MSKKMHVPHEMAFHRPISVYAMAVSESGFGRVCPRCGEKWSAKANFIADNEMVGSRNVPISIPDPIGDGYSTISIQQRIYRHSCGGEMLIDIDSSTHQKRARRDTINRPVASELGK